MNKRKGSPYDRGGADSYYQRGRDPHYFKKGALSGERTPAREMSEKDLADYEQGYQDNEDDQNFKDWE